MSVTDTFIQTLARRAGAVVLKRFGKDGVHYTKSEQLWDVVTRADLLAEKMITSAIKKAYPDHGIIAEESGRMNDNAEYVWIVDPIDGTANYAAGIPLFGVMICLAHNKKIILSVVYLPATKELYFAKAGKGAYLNGRKIHCTRTKTFSRSYGMASSSLRTRTGLFFRNLLKGEKDSPIMLGAFGSVAANASCVASGKRDWIVQLVGELHDFAPISLLLKEAGCTVTNLKGKPWSMADRELIAANPTLHKHLLKLVKGI